MTLLNNNILTNAIGSFRCPLRLFSELFKEAGGVSVLIPFQNGLIRKARVFMELRGTTVYMSRTVKRFITATLF